MLAATRELLIQMASPALAWVRISSASSTLSAPMSFQTMGSSDYRRVLVEIHACDAG